MSMADNLLPQAADTDEKLQAALDEAHESDNVSVDYACNECRRRKARVRTHANLVRVALLGANF